MLKKAKIRKGDKVILIAGKDKGKTGTVSAVHLKDERVTVSGINLAKKHQKPTPVAAGGIVTKELPVHISNVALLDPQDGKATRAGFIEQNGKKVRVSKRSQQAIA
jgi:large subunit ribosomal protein L24